MTIALLFWILMLFWLIGGVYARWPQTQAGPWPRVWFPDLLLFILILLLGWHAFGAPLR